MLAACKGKSAVMQRVASLAVSAFGPHVLPGERTDFDPPTQLDVWNDLLRHWSTELGRFNDVAIHLRRPAKRRGASLLLLDDGSPTAFVKLRPNNSRALDVERKALEILGGGGDSFLTPTVRGHGEAGGWSYLALSPLPPTIHRMPLDPPLLGVTAEYGETLRRHLEPIWTHSGWIPMHGDLTPWNLRELSGQRLVLFDWEGVDWAPPQADLLWYDATVLIKGLKTQLSGIDHRDEAIGFWISRLEERVRPGERSLAATVYRKLTSGWRPG